MGRHATAAARRMHQARELVNPSPSTSTSTSTSTRTRARTSRLEQRRPSVLPACGCQLERRHHHGGAARPTSDHRLRPAAAVRCLLAPRRCWVLHAARTSPEKTRRDAAQPSVACAQAMPRARTHAAASPGLAWYRPRLPPGAAAVAPPRLPRTLAHSRWARPLGRRHGGVSGPPCGLHGLWQARRALPPPGFRAPAASGTAWGGRGVHTACVRLVPGERSSALLPCPSSGRRTL